MYLGASTFSMVACP